MPAFGCPLALLLPVRIATAGDGLIVVSEATDELVPVVWPSGWAAWRIEGRAVLVARDGSVVGRDGDVLTGFGGGVYSDNAFHVCVIGE